MKILNCLTVTLLLLPPAGFAQTLSVKPGLWEHQVQVKSESGRLEAMMETARAQMAAMPAAQRQMMENMMAQQGIRFDLANQSFQNCISEEDASNGAFNFSKENQCEQSNVRVEGSTTRINFTCAQAQGEMQFKDGTEYSGTSTTTMKVEGKDEVMTSTHNGRWLGASCAGIE